MSRGIATLPGEKLAALLRLVMAAALAGCAGGASRPRAEPVSVPAAPGSGEPNLVAGLDGRVYLSWLEPRETGGVALRFALWDAGGWSAARTIAGGSDWLVNWADFPSLAALADGTLAAHWLRKVSADSYAYDVLLAVSTDAGRSWSEPVRPHADGTASEHGFVSLVPNAEGFSVFWLDGREVAGAEHGDAGQGRGATGVRHAVLDREGRTGAETVIDARVCDCCATDAVAIPGGIAVAYRDRSETEVRDVSVVRLEAGAWSRPSPASPDGWMLPGCPVNGPALAADGERVALAWFTAAGDAPAVKLALSQDAGRRFGAPIRIDAGQPEGRVDVLLLGDGSAVVSWLEVAGTDAELRLRRVSASGQPGSPVTLAALPRARSAGFPRLARLGERLVAAWTEPGPPATIRSAVVSFE